ncbi:hypothetical protein G7059_06435 [Erysipelothrix sp. HDW6A]|uniref:methyltransferase RsmF C-terminal domain-like protein n=1 Tax=Erysipelothrix sp. HDW6A TaxID=2714928 RepID=UPI00140D6E09|nr:hypothetical protein [Erysipelothrix sp. HDW6A]QIK57503.1 hypothetical protein G7059_06435 [Erysipelothrix sp. HDW6A]
MQEKRSYKDMLLNLAGAELTHKILEAYQFEPIRGIRFNSQKYVENPFPGVKSRLNDEVWIADAYAATVTHPFHHAGCYYIQDPSATTPVLALDLNESDIVLDMCAAPGGKSTYILDKIPHGFLISNDIDKKRNLKLCENLDRWGVENVVVVCNESKDLVEEFESVFDKVLLDAPCSGEGLFRKDKDFMEHYDSSTAFKMAAIQKELLIDAYHCVKDNGVIVYSTCTLNDVENELVILDFLSKYPSCELETLNFENSYPGYHGLGTKVTRYFPNEDGEGHFVARIRVHKASSHNELQFSKIKYKKFQLESLKLHGNFRTIGSKQYGTRNRGFLKTSLNVMKDGTLISDDKGRYYDVNHALSQSIVFAEDIPSYECSLEEAYRYLNGQQLNLKLKGFYCIKYLGNSLGFIKGDGKRANNRYPKHLRNRFETYETVSLV